MKRDWRWNDFIIWLRYAFRILISKPRGENFGFHIKSDREYLKWLACSLTQPTIMAIHLPRSPMTTSTLKDRRSGTGRNADFGQSQIITFHFTRWPQAMSLQQMFYRYAFCMRCEMHCTGTNLDRKKECTNNKCKVEIETINYLTMNLCAGRNDIYALAIDITLLIKYVCRAFMGRSLSLSPSSSLPLPLGGKFGILSPSLSFIKQNISLQCNY